MCIRDSCNDATPEIAKEYGGIALLRNDPLHPGKTQNIRWALNNIPLDEYEAVVIFDADNLANPHFLSQMNDYLEAHPGAEAVQGYLDTKNFSDSWLTRVYALAYWYTCLLYTSTRILPPTVTWTSPLLSSTTATSTSDASCSTR